jgi:hypothetical protein
VILVHVPLLIMLIPLIIAAHGPITAQPWLLAARASLAATKMVGRVRYARREID